MVFGSPIFLLAFLPAVLAAYFLLGRRLRNPVLLIFSLFFYAWGEKELVLLMIASIAANYGFGRWLAAVVSDRGRRGVVAVAVVFNLGLLIFYKYANFLRDSLAELLGAAGLPGVIPELAPIHLPIGISFFTFQAMTYVIDLYRGDAPLQKNPFSFGVYISLFPQLIAGPIVRYNEIAQQLVHRVVNREGFAEGVRRFVIGLAKKVLIADTVAAVCDRIFDLPGADLNAGVAWLGIVCYTLQIYFDFSGYSDMAIGLGRMFGFRFPENFRYPYVASSITDFWRRWHMTLSFWFRDYLYIPLGGNRGSSFRTGFNLITVFFLCGLWHGASWSFVVWGLFHGGFLLIERFWLRRVLDASPRLLVHLYVPLVVAVGWVFFRAPNLSYALTYLGAMFGFGAGNPAAWNIGVFMNPLLLTVLAAGVIGSMPVFPWLGRWRERVEARTAAGSGSLFSFGCEAVKAAVILLMLYGAALNIAAGTYSPFIYFRF